MIEAPASACYAPFETIKTPEGKVDHSFGPYSETREHLMGWLPKLMQKLGVSDGLNVELGSGRGHSGEYILPYVGVAGQMIMSEPDVNGFENCTARYSNDSRVEVRNKSALATLSELEDGSVDRIYYLNAIHLDADKEKVIELAFRKLKPGGLFIANSSFIFESEPKSEVPMYTRWMAQSYLRLKEADPELYRYLRENRQNLKRIRRDPKSQYDILFETKGFSLRDLTKDGLGFDQPESQLANSFVGLFRIAQYQVWIDGTMPNVVSGEGATDEEVERRLDLLTKAQQKALLDIYPKMIGPRISPRNNAIWVAEKPNVASREDSISTGTWARPLVRYSVLLDVV